MLLEERYATDPELLEFYKRKLLEPGWAGELGAVELAYIKSQLRESPSLKRRWGFKPSARRLSEKRTRTIAIDGRLSTNEKRVLASAVGEQRPCEWYNTQKTPDFWRLATKTSLSSR